MVASEPSAAPALAIELMISAWTAVARGGGGVPVGAVEPRVARRDAYVGFNRGLRSVIHFQIFRKRERERERERYQIRGITHEVRRCEEFLTP